MNPRRLVPTPAEATSGVERERSRAGHSTRASSSSPARSHHRHHLGYLSRLSRSRSASIARRGSGRSRASRAPKGAGDPAGRFVAGGPPMPGQTYSRLGSLGGAPSPPPVPPAVAAVASLQRGGGGSGRRTPGKGGSASASAAAGWTGVGCGCAARRAARAVLAALHRRQAVFLFAPLLYVAAMLLYMGSIPLDVVPRIVARPAPGSVYRSPQLYARLRADMDADNSTDAVSGSSFAGLLLCVCISVAMWHKCLTIMMISCVCSCNVRIGLV